MRKDLGPKSLMFPEPVLIIGTYDEKGNPDAMNAAWGGISDTNEIHICLSKTHKTVKNLLKTKEFTVSPATKEYVKECDYLGMVSGNKEKHKLDNVHFHVIKSSHINAPIIEELPFTLECKLKSYDSKTGHLYANIINISCDSKVMSKGKVDIKKLKPIIFNGEALSYHVIGEKVGNAFKDYKKIK